MLKAVWALVLVVATASAQFVNHFEVLGVAENCSTAELSRAYKLLALKAHPDKNDGSSEANAFFVRLTEAYSVLKNDKTRREFVEELRFFRTHGRVRWTMRYRLYPRTNVYVVIIATILVSVAMQMYLKWWWHKRMYAAARNTDLYQKELARRIAEGLDPDVPIEVKGAEAPVWSDMWPIQLFLIPYRLYVYFAIDRPQQMKASEEFMAAYNAMTPQEKRKVQKRYWKSKNQ